MVFPSHVLPQESGSQEVGNEEWTAGSTSALTDGRRKLFVAGGQRTNGTRALLIGQLRLAQTPREPDFSRESTRKRSFLAGLGGGLGGLARSLGFLDGLDDTNSDGLSHVSDGESSKWWVLREGLDAHRLGGGHEDDGGITGLDLLGEVFHLLTGSSIDLLLEFGELAGDVGSVAIEDWGVAVSDLTRVVHDDDLSGEGLGLLGGVVLGVGCDVSSSDVLDGNVLDVESDVVTGAGLWEGLVVHLDGLNFSGDVDGGEGGEHAGLDDTGLDSADWHRSNTTDLVDILEGKSEWLAGGSRWWDDGVEGFEHGLAGELALLHFLAPSLVPFHVGGLLNHVVSVPSRDGDESNGLGVESNLLDVVGDFGSDFSESLLAVCWLSGVHLVDSNDELLDTEGVGEESVLSCLAVLGDTSFELTNTGGDDEDGAIGLGGTGDHVLDEITVTGGVNDGDVELVGLELPEGDIDGDTSFSLGLQLVQNPGVLEGTFTHLMGFLLELLDGSLVDTSALVDEVTGSSGFTGIDVADNDDVNMSLFFSHGGSKIC